MSNKNYIKGRTFEYRIQNYLRGKGYYVIRAYGSKGVYDLIAVPPTNHLSIAPFCEWQNQPLGIQCKTNGYIPPKERARFKDIIKKWQLWSILAYREGRKLIFKDIKTQEVLVI